MVFKKSWTESPLISCHSLHPPPPPSLSLFLSQPPGPYLFKVVSQKNKIDTAESQLRDNQEEVHSVPEGGEGRYTKIMIKSKTPWEMLFEHTFAPVITDPSNQVTRMSAPGERRNCAKCHQSRALEEGEAGAACEVSKVPFLASGQECCTRPGEPATEWPEQRTSGPLPSPWPPLPMAHLSHLIPSVLQRQGTLNITARKCGPLHTLCL